MAATGQTTRKNDKTPIKTADGSSVRTEAMRKTPMDLHVGGRIKRRRVEVGLAATALGRAIGITRQAMERLERGDIRVHAGRIHEIATILDIHPGWFFDGFAMAGTAAVPHNMNSAIDRVLKSGNIAVIDTFLGLTQEQQRIVSQMAEAFAIQNGLADTSERVDDGGDRVSA